MASRSVQIGEFGAQVSANLFIVSWLGMTEGELDCHVYVLRGDDGLVMIDCGTPWGHERLKRTMTHWGLPLEEVRTILLTHGHVDHGRGGYLFKRRSIEILAHPVAAELAEREWQACLADEGSTTAYTVDGHLREGDRIERAGLRFEVFETPGHTAGCVSFLTVVDGARCLFSGDLIMGNGLPGYRGDPGYSEGSISTHLQRLGELDIDHLLYGHEAIRHDRGRLFRKALQCQAAGAWKE